jgi:hypothetical protein
MQLLATVHVGWGRRSTAKTAGLPNSPARGARRKSAGARLCPKDSARVTGSITKLIVGAKKPVTQAPIKAIKKSAAVTKPFEAVQPFQS